MTDHTDLLFVLNKRNEAAKILRQHNETASQTGAIYAAAARHVGVFRDALRQSGYDAASFADAVRTIGALITNLAPQTTRAATEVGGLSRSFEGTRDILEDVAAGTVAQGRAQSSLAIGSIDGQARLVRVDGRGSEDGHATPTPGTMTDLVDAVRALGATRAAIHSPDKPAVASPLEVAVARGSVPAGGRQSRPTLDMPAVLLANPGSSAVAIEELKAAFSAMLGSPPAFSRAPDPTTVVGHHDLTDDEKLDRGRSAIDLEKLADPLRRILEVSIALRQDLQNRIERADGKPEPTSRSHKDDELDLEWLSDVLGGRERLQDRREIRDAIEGGRSWLREYRDTEPAPLGARRPAVAEWTDRVRPSDGPRGADVRETAEDWRAYGNGLATAMAATDQALAGILTQTRDWRSAMHGLINAVVADFARMAVRQTVTAPLAEMVLGGGKGADGPSLLGRAWNWITSLFAGGGIMTERGPLPLRAYASGGIATSPQLALFGEGSTPEAYVPVPNGRIPVTLRGGKGIDSIATNIVVNVSGGGTDGTPIGPVGGDPAEQARNIGALVTAAFNRNLAEQMRPGGLLNPAGYLGSGLAH